MSAGITRVLIAEALDSGLKRQQILPAIPATRLVVCRLCARLETMKDRVRRREPGMLQDALVARVIELEASLDPRAPRPRLKKYLTEVMGRCT